MKLRIVNSSNLSADEKQQMFDMYVLSYTMGGQDLWFKSADELFQRYPCAISFDHLYLSAYAMFQFKSHFNKISLVCHDGSDKGKQMSIDLRVALVKSPGWILEAADKVSWVLRKNNSPILSDYESIVNALDIKHNP